MELNEVPIFHSVMRFALMFPRTLTGTPLLCSQQTQFVAASLPARSAESRGMSTVQRREEAMPSSWRANVIRLNGDRFRATLIRNRAPTDGEKIECRAPNGDVVMAKVVGNSVHHERGEDGLKAWVFAAEEVASTRHVRYPPDRPGAAQIDDSPGLRSPK
jgi:hypothetical protein